MGRAAPTGTERGDLGAGCWWLVAGGWWLVAGGWWLVSVYHGMSFICPECGAPALTIAQRVELPPDGRFDEICLQVVRCGECNFGGTAVYAESRRGALDAEYVEHTGYRVSAAVLRKLSSLMAHCPAPGDKRCACATHQILGQRDAQSYWKPPNWLAWEDSFSLHFSISPETGKDWRN